MTDTYNFMEGVNYMLQILMACNLFIILLEKKKNYPVRIAIGMIGELAMAGLLGEYFPMPEYLPISFLYWGIFMWLCVPYLWFVCKLTWMEAIYCVVCGFAVQHFASEFCVLARILIGDYSWTILIYFILYAATYSFFFITCLRKIVTDGIVDVKIKKTVILMLAILLIALVLSVTKRRFYSDESRVLAIICQIYDMMCCFFILWTQVGQKEALHLQHELDCMDYIWHSQQEAFMLTQVNIDVINRKCHDLKHQISALRTIDSEADKKEYIKSIEDAIMIYDASLDTGNEVINTVIMEKSLYCKEHAITMTCIADASKLNFMNTFDLYTIFANALDNAIESVNQLEVPEKKAVIVKIINRDELILLQIENYYGHSLEFEEGLPVTTKADKNFHGYGMKSMKQTVEKYNGCITISTENYQFRLQILLPVPS